MLNVQRGLWMKLTKKQKMHFVATNSVDEVQFFIYFYCKFSFSISLSLSYSFSLALATEITRNHLNKSQTTNDTVCVCVFVCARAAWMLFSSWKRREFGMVSLWTHCFILSAATFAHFQSALHSFVLNIYSLVFYYYSMLTNTKHEWNDAAIINNNNNKIKRYSHWKIKLS